MLWRDHVLLQSPDGSGGGGSDDPTVVATPDTTPTPIIDWEKKYKGLQTAFNKLNTEKQKLTEDLNNALAAQEEVGLKIKGFEKQIADLQASLDGEKKNTESAKTEATTRSVEAIRARLILKEFPELAQFEASGLLPAATTEEEMRTKFNEYKTTLNSIVGKSVVDKLKGASLPTSSASQNTRDADTVYAELMRVAGVRGKEAEFRKLQAEYDQLTAPTK